MTEDDKAMVYRLRYDCHLATQLGDDARIVLPATFARTIISRIEAQAAEIERLRQSQTDARVADLLFKLDVAATTFEKVTTSEHREAVFNAEHAKLLRDTIKALHQPQTDALKKARGAINGLLDIASEENLDSEQAGRAYAALHEIGTALEARGLEIREKGQ
jgi:hypothetical protein